MKRNINPTNLTSNAQCRVSQAQRDLRGGSARGDSDEISSTAREGRNLFFTVVTHDRRPFLCEPKNIELLRESFRKVMAAHPFSIEAIVIMPDQFHALWTLAAEDVDFSRRWSLIKSGFTRGCDDACKA